MHDFSQIRLTKCIIELFSKKWISAGKYLTYGVIQQAKGKWFTDNSGTSQNCSINSGRKRVRRVRLYNSGTYWNCTILVRSRNAACDKQFWYVPELRSQSTTWLFGEGGGGWGGGGGGGGGGRGVGSEYSELVVMWTVKRFCTNSLFCKLARFSSLPFQSPCKATIFFLSKWSYMVCS